MDHGKPLRPQPDGWVFLGLYYREESPNTWELWYRSEGHRIAYYDCRYDRFHTFPWGSGSISSPAHEASLRAELEGLAKVSKKQSLCR